MSELSWAAQIYGRLKDLNISEGELAREAHLSLSYLSCVLHGKRGKGEKAKARIIDAMTRLEEKHAYFI